MGDGLSPIKLAHNDRWEANRIENVRNSRLPQGTIPWTIDMNTSYPAFRIFLSSPWQISGQYFEAGEPGWLSHTSDSTKGWTTWGRFPTGGFFYLPPRPDRLWDPSDLVPIRYRDILLREQSGCSVKLITHCHTRAYPNVSGLSR
jgi:hypothetical protein